MPQAVSVSQVESTCARRTSWTALQTEHKKKAGVAFFFELDQGLALDALELALDMAIRTMQDAHRQTLIIVGVLICFWLCLC